MPSNNRLQSIWTVLARSTRCNPYTTPKDIATFRRRASAEGSTYYARDLRTLRVAFLAGLESGQLDIAKCRFRRRRGTSLPAFLFDAFHSVFDKTGWIRPDADAGAVSCINLLTGVFTKIKGGHAPETEIDVINSFIKTEEEIQNTCLTYADRFTVDGVYITASGVMTRARSLISAVLRGLSPREISPSHGSGVSADGVAVYARYGVPRFIKKIDDIWPMSEFYTAGYTAMCDLLQEFQSAKEADPCAKVLLVPKDVRGPRLISCEPHERMWIQQGLMNSLYERIEAHPLTRGSVNFTDQRYNQVAAYRGSLPQETSPTSWVDTPVGVPIAVTYPEVSNPECTLDLKDASDRLRLDVVEALFPPEWKDALLACRSGTTKLPDGRIISMSKHAPMGSAVCFPVMALCIWSLLSAVVPPRRRKTILVYGDDIVVRRDDVQNAIRALEMVGFIVNQNKSFSHGNFRESCGKEYFKGVDVTPIYLRNMPDDDVESRISLISFTNNFYLWQGSESELLIKHMRTWYGLMPETRYHGTTTIAGFDEVERKIVLRTSQVRILPGCLLRDLPNNEHIRQRWNRRLNCRQYRILTCVPVEVEYHKDDWGQVLRALTKPRKNPFGSDALAKRVHYKWVWTSDMVSYTKE